MTRFLTTTALGAAVAVAFAASVGAEPLRMAVGVEPSAIDPHYHNLGPNSQMARHVFGSLVAQDDKQRLIPDLALSWKAIDDVTWEFKLRPNVKWHDGTPFTAEDVAASFKRAPNVPNSPSSYGIYLRQVTETKVIDPLTVHVKAKTVFPLMANYLSSIFIVKKEMAEKATTEDYNTGKAAIGTGPYKFVEWVPGDRIVYERFDGYFGDKQPWTKVTVKPITNNSSRVAALLAGDVDFIDQVPTADIENLKKNDKVSLSQGVSNRVIYLHLDHFRDTSPFIKGADGQPLAKNPLRDLRVRQALSLAINRPAIVERVMSGVAIPAGQLLPEGFYGVSPKLKPDPYDPNRAKKLLAEAGFPNGFQLTAHGPNGRYINDAKILQAVAQFWTRIGVKTEVDVIAPNVFFTRASQGANGQPEFSLILVGWGSGTGEASSPLSSLLATFDKAKGRGASNRGRYSNPEMDKLLDQALMTNDDDAREKLLIKATEVSVGDLGIIPLHYQVNTWATKKGLRYIPRTDENTNALGVVKAN